MVRQTIHHGSNVMDDLLCDGEKGENILTTTQLKRD
jgi:hypothetical protein